MVLQTRLSGQRRVGYPGSGWFDPGGQDAMEEDLTYLLDLIVARDPSRRCFALEIRSNPDKYYTGDFPNPTKAAVENDLNELIAMFPGPPCR
jgi:hypothetical protein